MAQSTQEVFLSQVRAALRDRGEAVPLPETLEVARVVQGGTDHVAMFLARVEEARMQAHRVADEAGAAAKVAQIAAGLSAKTALVPEEEMPGREEIIATLREQGVRLMDADDLDAAFTADVGITGVSCAVAETASIALLGGGPRRRLASVAVPCHIGIVDAEQIVPDLLDWAARQQGTTPSYQVLVSGPSKTADIELALVIGVHGPKEQHVIVVG